MKIRSAISDAGLQLGALDALLSAGTLDKARLAPALATATAAIKAEPSYWNGEEISLDDDNDYAMLGLAVGALGDIEVTEAELASVTSISFDGGNDIYMWLEPGLAEALGLEDYRLDTGGESDVYVVQTLDGIAGLPSLEKLNLGAYGYSYATRTLAPLGGHPALKEIILAGKFTDQAALLEIPKLTKVKFAAHEALDAAVQDGLRKKGIELVEG